MFKNRVNIKHYPDAKIDKHDRNIHNYLTLQKHLNNWIDVEIELMKYATNQTVEYHKEGRGLTIKPNASDETIRTSYNILCLDLKTYINSIDYSIVNKNSSSLALLTQIASHRQNQIVTFNYTDIVELVGHNAKCNVEYIHGNAKNKILLGFQRFDNIAPGYDYMIKSENPDYKSCHLSDKMIAADEIVIFGHSMGITDHFYFQKFFDTQIQSNASNKQLTIFTKDRIAKESITKQLVALSHNKYGIFLDNTNVDVIVTEKNEEGLANFIKELKKRQRKYYF